MISGELNQSTSLPLSSITCSAPTHTTRSANPTLSTGRRRVGVSRLDRLVQQMAAQTIPTGRLIRNIHGHWKLSEM